MPESTDGFRESGVVARAGYVETPARLAGTSPFNTALEISRSDISRSDISQRFRIWAY